MLQSGRLIVEDLISHTIVPDDIEKGYEGLLNHKDDYWGLVIDWT
jgi:threonine dehydrogenase-like Zn-dependent dehydrogenase